MADELKNGAEILDEYFKKLKENTSISENLRVVITSLLEQKKLNTRTNLTRELDELRNKAK